MFNIILINHTICIGLNDIFDGYTEQYYSFEVPTSPTKNVIAEYNSVSPTVKNHYVGNLVSSISIEPSVSSGKYYNLSFSKYLITLKNVYLNLMLYTN